MGLFDFFWSSRRLTITHKGSDNVELNEIANDTNFFRQDSGSTTISGSVGYNVKINISEQSNVIIRGNIGAKCQIFKDGDGTLTIDGEVARDLKLTIYGQGKVYFTRQPHADVIKSIKRGSVTAEIYCAGILLPAPSSSYTHHNMGRYTPPEPIVIVRNIPVPASSSLQQTSVADQYTEYAQAYIDGFHRANPESIAARVEKLGKLSPQEEELLEEFIDPIMKYYFSDIPVGYKEAYYDLSTLNLLDKDPITKKPIKLSDIQAGRKLLEKFEVVLSSIQLNRQKVVTNSEPVEHESSMSPSM
ncbi:hypothetical protein [Legionella rowbothamii]|uniref:hypothetical protein n=1 Tax=Legionella rowbothamii TaxID=96229 RepID=UPI0010542EF7|nr:hypothetical protein [Legionella rowbothamii]